MTEKHTCSKKAQKPLRDIDLFRRIFAQNGKVNHLFYMDDLKTFAKDDSQQEGLLNIVKTFSDVIKMKFGLDKVR